jgi:hypothetical protein
MCGSSQVTRTTAEGIIQDPHNFHSITLLTNRSSPASGSSPCSSRSGLGGARPRVARCTPGVVRCFFSGIVPPTSSHYKSAWFAGRGSLAPTHIRIFLGTGWSVSAFLLLFWCIGCGLSLCPPAPTLCPHTPCIHAHVQASVSHYLQTCTLTRPSLSSYLLSLQHPCFFCSCPVRFLFSTLTTALLTRVILLGTAMETIGTGVGVGALPSV